VLTWWWFIVAEILSQKRDEELCCCYFVRGLPRAISLCAVSHVPPEISLGNEALGKPAKPEFQKKNMNNE